MNGFNVPLESMLSSLKAHLPNKDSKHLFTFRLAVINLLSFSLILSPAANNLIPPAYESWLTKIGFWLLSGYGIGRYIREEDKQVKQM